MLPHVQSAADLVTSRASTRDGFLKQALSKTHKAVPYIKEANELAAALDATQNIEDLAHTATKSIKNALFAAAGFSDKARRRMTDAELEPALTQVLVQIKASAPDAWRSEIVYRFLLTRGDTLGGSMRNTTGAAGGAQFSRVIVTALQAVNIPHTTIHAPKNPEKIVSLKWNSRLLVFDRKPLFLNNNIDVILLDTDAFSSEKRILEEPATYLACGELKGGIDPAGADEHWKTAQSAFDRIRERFTRQNLHIPALFFVGAAIETTMAEQVYAQLQNGRLGHAANFTVPQQVSALADWLTAL